MGGADFAVWPTLRSTPRVQRLPILAFLTIACAPALTNYQLGETEFAAGNAEAAEKHWKDALDDPADADRAEAQLVELWLGRAEELESYAGHRALTLYEDILTLDPGSIPARLGSARILETEGRMHEAVEVLTDPACENCGRQLGEVFEHRAAKALAEKRYEDAAKDLGQALRMNPTAAVYIDLAELATAGRIGGMRDAVDNMARAHPLLGNETVLQQRWWVQRTAVAIETARARH